VDRGFNRPIRLANCTSSRRSSVSFSRSPFSSCNWDDTSDSRKMTSADETFSGRKLISFSLSRKGPVKRLVRHSVCRPNRRCELGEFPNYWQRYFRPLFAYTVFVWNLPESRLCDFTVRCKSCGENVPAPVETMPSSWIVARCPLCSECRYYLPAEIFRGRLSARLLRKPVRSARWAD